jgi:hypothetical protein
MTAMIFENCTTAQRDKDCGASVSSAPPSVTVVLFAPVFAPVFSVFSICLQCSQPGRPHASDSALDSSVEGFKTEYMTTTAIITRSPTQTQIAGAFPPKNFFPRKQSPGFAGLQYPWPEGSQQLGSVLCELAALVAPSKLSRGTSDCAAFMLRSI